jgi:hypothetical protein
VLQVPLVTRVVLENTACLAPLVAALDEARAAGVVLASLGGVRAVEIALGTVSEVSSFAFEEPTEGRPEMRGPVAFGPARHQQTVSQRDRFEQRLDEHRAQFYGAVAGELAVLAGRRAWDRILIAGDGRLTSSLVGALGAPGREVMRVDRGLDGLTVEQLLSRVAPPLEEATRRRELALVGQARATALSGGAGALGLADTLTALAERRVAHLLFDREREYRGTRTPEGRLLPAGEVPPGIEESQLILEPQLAERMIEQAFDIGAKVTPLKGDAARALAESDGVAAVLRW